MPTRLVTEETIRVPTAEGIKEIQLLFGDITQLSIIDKVDLIMVSAYHGDYAPIEGTVIGALRHIGLGVYELSRNKAEDLRRQFHCWWSQPLPDILPYRRLLCFETSGTRTAPHMAVGEVFRALISASVLFQEGGGSIISPLLSTGNQGFSSGMMLRALVDAAANWMQCGLNVRTFKIVVYQPSKNLKELFVALKEKWESKVVAPVEEARKEGIETPLYLCYHQDDTDQVKNITGTLQRKSPAIKMEDGGTVNLNQEDWMVPVSAKMKSYRRVLVFLSPAFVNDETCVQLYNLALCTSRLMENGFLSPFYIHTVTPIPTYMTMVQWIDVRVLTDGDSEKLSVFVQSIVTLSPKSIGENSLPTAGAATSEASAAVKTQRTYKVFISYCHKDSSAAELVLNKLASRNPTLSVFFDRKELRVGTSWQLALYDALQNAQVVVAFLSESYTQSAMCQEEFALSIMRYCIPGASMHLLPILLDEEAAGDAVVESGYAGSPIKPYRGQEGLKKIHDDVCKAVEQFANDGKVDGKLLSHSREPLDPTSVLQAYRKRFFEEVHARTTASERSRASVSAAAPADAGSETSRCALIISCSSDAPAERRLRQVLERARPGRGRLTVPPARGSGGAPSRYKLVDEADVIVALVSPDLAGSPEDYEELQVAISRQRRNRGRRLFYPVLTYDCDPSSLAYLSLLCYVASTNDDWWSWTRMRRALVGTLGDSPAADSEVDTPLVNCMEFCRNVIELDLQNETPNAIPGCNGDILLNIVAVKLWLSTPVGKNATAVGGSMALPTVPSHNVEDKVKDTSTACVFI